MNAPRRLLLFAGLVFLAGLVYSLHLGDLVRYTDERDYIHLARNLADTGRYTYDGVQPTAIRTPGYPLFLAMFLKAGAGLLVLRLAGFLAFASTIVFTFLVVARVGTRRAAWIAALLVAAYPVLFYTAGTFYPQTLSSLLLLGSLWILAGDRPVGAPGHLVAGLLLAIAIFLVPNFIFTFAVLAGWVLLREKRRALLALLCLFLPVVLLTGAWAARNYRVLHAFVPLSTNGGVTLLNGNCATTEPNSSVFDASAYVPDVDALRRMSEVDRDRFYRDQAVRFIRENKAYALKLYVAKFVNWFHYRNRLTTPGEATRTNDLIMLVTYWPLLFVLLVRLLLVRRFPLGRFEMLLLVLYVGNGLFLSIFLPRIRYRLPFDYGLIMMVAIFADAALRPGIVGRPAAD